MAGPGLATRDDLLHWPSVVAAGEFPRLLRRLIWETAPDAVRLGFPAGSGTSAGSWDGSVRTVVGTTYVPAGLSVWELSVQASGIGAKADGDYGKRVSTPDGSPVSEAVYVEAMLRPWLERQDWAAGPSAPSRMSEASSRIRSSRFQRRSPSAEIRCACRSLALSRSLRTVRA